MDENEAERVRLAGIEQAPAPCFYPEDVNGHAFEWGDGTPHWATASEAWRMMHDIRRCDRGVEIALRRETAPCWHIACDECGYRYDEDEWCCHFSSEAEARAAAEDSDWVIVDGRLLCSGCDVEQGSPPARWPIPCSTEGCDGDGRYAAPGRGHVEGCTHPLPATPPGAACACGSPETYSLKPSEVIVHAPDGCTVERAATPPAQTGSAQWAPTTRPTTAAAEGDER